MLHLLLLSRAVSAPTGFSLQTLYVIDAQYLLDMCISLQPVNAPAPGPSGESPFISYLPFTRGAVRALGRGTLPSTWVAAS